MKSLLHSAASLLTDTSRSTVPSKMIDTTNGAFSLS